MPHNFTFLSAEPDKSIALSLEMSKLKTGSLCPYKVRKSLSESEKFIMTL